MGNLWHQQLYGGVATGTVPLIGRTNSIYLPLLFQYFLVEGIVNNHTLLITSAEQNPAGILQEFLVPGLHNNCRKEFDE